MVLSCSAFARPRDGVSVRRCNRGGFGRDHKAKSVSTTQTLRACAALGQGRPGLRRRRRSTRRSLHGHDLAGNPFAHGEDVVAEVTKHVGFAKLRRRDGAQRSARSRAPALNRERER